MKTYFEALDVRNRYDSCCFGCLIVWLMGKVCVAEDSFHLLHCPVTLRLARCQFVSWIHMLLDTRVWVRLRVSTGRCNPCCCTLHHLKIPICGPINHPKSPICASIDFPKSPMHVFFDYPNSPTDGAFDCQKGPMCGSIDHPKSLIDGSMYIQYTKATTASALIQTAATMCAEGMTNDMAEDRVRKGITVSWRIRWAPLPLQTKASLTACLVGPAAMYGFPAGGCTPRLTRYARQMLQLCGARNAEADAVRLY